MDRQTIVTNIREHYAAKEKELDTLTAAPVDDFNRGYALGYQIALGVVAQWFAITYSEYSDLPDLTTDELAVALTDATV